MRGRACRWRLRRVASARAGRRSWSDTKGFAMTARMALVAREISLRQLALAALLALALAAALTQVLPRASGGASFGSVSIGASGAAHEGLSGLSPAARASISA